MAWQLPARSNTTQLVAVLEVHRLHRQSQLDLPHQSRNRETRFVDWDPWGSGGGRSGGGQTVNWSHDSQWITYARTFNDRNRSGSAIWVYNVENDEHHQLTSGHYGETMPVFDRKGDWLFYRTTRLMVAALFRSGYDVHLQ
jgi:hypothetical protein